MIPTRIAVFSHDWTSYDATMTRGLASGFRQCGIAALCQTPLVAPNELPAWCEANEADCVLEINRSRTQLPDLPETITHVGWLQDPPTVPGMEGVALDSRSDLTYYLGPELGYVEHEPRYLFCGIDPSLAKERVEAEALSDFVYVGYIPTHGDERMRYRTQTRRPFIEAAIAAGSVRLIGKSTWETWEQFKPHYCGWAEGPEEVIEAYRSAKIVLHENPHGHGLHSRVLDTMSVAGCIMSLATNDDGHPGGIATAFVPWQDYLPVTLDTLADVAEMWLPHTEDRQRIGASARAKVLGQHTWKHRAEQVLGDLEAL